MSRRESGYALLTALLVIFLLSVALAVLAVSLQIRLRTTTDDARRVVLSALSDAAVAEAVANLAQSAYYSGAPEHPFGGGWIASQVEPAGASLFTVTATATYKGRQRVVEATVFRSPGEAVQVRRWRRVQG